MPVSTQTQYFNDETIRLGQTDYGPLVIVGDTSVTRVRVHGAISFNLVNHGSPSVGKALENLIVHGVQHGPSGYTPYGVDLADIDIIPTWYGFGAVVPQGVDQFVAVPDGVPVWQWPRYLVDMDFLVQWHIGLAVEDWYYTVGYMTGIIDYYADVSVQIWTA